MSSSPSRRRVLSIMTSCAIAATALIALNPQVTEAATLQRHCDWNTTITGPASTTPSQAWVDALTQNRTDNLNSGLWTPDILFGQLDHDFSVPNPSDYFPRPLSDFGSQVSTDEYGWRIHPILGIGKWHSGYDFGGTTGDPLWALTTGTVIRTENRYPYGNMLVIDHGQGFTTVYAHLNSFAVSVGDQVVPGQVVGAVGATGRVGNDHLHFETRLGGVPVNPRYFVNDLATPGGLYPGVQHVSLTTIPNEEAARVYRLYSAYFQRCPDAEGFAYWVNTSNSGTTMERISDHFTGSSEFAHLYGANPSNAEFLELAYQNVMGRSSDSSGKAYWLQRMGAGMSQGEVMLYFSDAPEYQGLTGF